MHDQDEKHQDEKHQDEKEAPQMTAPSPGAMVGITIPTNRQDDPVGGGDDE